MSTTLHSFIDIFDSEFETDETSVKVNKIVIQLFREITRKVVKIRM